MANGEQDHLDSDQLLQAVVGESGLPRRLRTHLAQCTACRQEVDRLSGRFSAIGTMARDLSPDALGRVHLPKQRRRLFLGRRVGLRPALAMAVAVVLLMMIALYRPLSHRSTPMPPVPTLKAGDESSPEAEISLLAEIQDLLNNPLPQDYQQIAGDDSLFDVAGDLTDFIVPEVETETQKVLGRTHHTKGTA
jgi:hypothetical protein